MSAWPRRCRGRPGEPAAATCNLFVRPGCSVMAPTYHARAGVVPSSPSWWQGRRPTGDHAASRRYVVFLSRSNASILFDEQIRWAISIVHVAHAATTRHHGRSLLLRLLADHCFGSDPERRHGSGALQGEPHDHGRTDDAPVR